MKTNAKTLRFSALDCGIAVMTTLVLASILCFLGNHFYPRIMEWMPATPEPALASARVDATPEVKIDKTPARPQHAPDEEQELPPVLAKALSPASTGLTLTPTFIGQAVLTMALGLLLTFFVALAFAFCVLTLLRRHMREFGALIKVDAQLAPPIIINPVAPAPTPSPTPSDRPSSTYVNAFELERQARDEAAKRQDAAVLQQLFEDNLKLQAEIGQQQAKRV